MDSFQKAELKTKYGTRITHKAADRSKGKRPSKRVTGYFERLIEQQRRIEAIERERELERQRIRALEEERKRRLLEEERRRRIMLEEEERQLDDEIERAGRR